jgi:LPXTG-motif cell wall-anchored protein
VAFTVTGTSVGRNGSIVAGSDAVDPARADNTATIAVPVPAGSGPQGTLAQGRLPVTGPRSGPAAGTGAALLILGGALVLLARRRRPAAVSE